MITAILTEIRADTMQKWERPEISKKDASRYIWLAPFQSLPNVALGATGVIDFIKAPHYALWKLRSFKPMPRSIASIRSYYFRELVARYDREQREYGGVALDALHLDAFRAMRRLAQPQSPRLEAQRQQSLERPNQNLGANPPMTEWQTNYHRRVNAERLARQAPDVQKTVKEILEELKSIEQSLYWAIDPEDNRGLWENSIIEHAHALVDLGHDYRAGLIANPPPKEDDETDRNDEDAEKPLAFHSINHHIRNLEPNDHALEARKDTTQMTNQSRNRGSSHGARRHSCASLRAR